MDEVRTVNDYKGCNHSLSICHTKLKVLLCNQWADDTLVTSM